MLARGDSSMHPVLLIFISFSVAQTWKAFWGQLDDDFSPSSPNQNILQDQMPKGNDHDLCTKAND